MPELLMSLILVAAVMTVTPGPATLLAAVTGARFGFQRSIPLVAGVAAGLAALMAAAATGLAALLQSAPVFLLAMKVVGSAYLVWLAWKIGRSGAPDLKSNTTTRPAGFGSGFVLLWLNPKAWAMALAATAAYAELAPGPLQLALVLGSVFGIAVVLALSLWSAGGAALGRMLRSGRRWQIVNATLGLLTAASVILLWL